jgi:hypothetical protein
MLASLIIIGLAGNPATPPLAAIIFGALMLLLARLGQQTLGDAQERSPPTRRQRAWNAAAFVGWVVLMTLLVWLYAVRR